MERNSWEFLFWVDFGLVVSKRSDGVIAVIGGKQNAELELKKFETCQDSSDRHEGWRYLIEETDLKAGTDPAEATNIARLNWKRES